MTLDGLPCPSCGSQYVKVIDTRPVHGTIRRRRECVKCKERFFTKEVFCDLAGAPRKSVFDGQERVNLFFTQLTAYASEHYDTTMTVEKTGVRIAISGTEKHPPHPSVTVSVFVRLYDVRRNTAWTFDDTIANLRDAFNERLLICL